MKIKGTTRDGLATVELLTAMPILAIVFSALMFLAHASYKKNDDYSRKYRTLMSRHTLKPPQFDESKTTQLSRLAIDDDQKNSVRNFFPATESWTATASQPLDYKPPTFSSVSSNTAEISGMIYKGTGSPEFRTSNLIAPAQDKVEQLGISIAAKAIGKELDQILDDVGKFKDLLTVIESVKKAVDVDIDDIMNQAEEAGKEAAEQLVEFIKEEAAELAKSALTRDWEKIRRLREQIDLTRKAIEQIGEAATQFSELQSVADEFSAADEN